MIDSNRFTSNSQSSNEISKPMAAKVFINDPGWVFRVEKRKKIQKHDQKMRYSSIF